VVCTVPYQKSDLWHDTQQGYLQITSGGRAEGGRAPPEIKAHRDRHTAKKRGEGQEQEQGSREAHSRIGAHF
jgi:hypothetical protein